MRFANNASGQAADLTDVAAHVVACLARQANGEMPQGIPAFTLGGVPVSPSELSAPSGLLPAFVWHANRLHQYGMGADSGIEPEYYADGPSLLGRSVSLARFSGVNAQALLFVCEAFHQVRETLAKNPVNGVSVELSELVREFTACFSQPNADAGPHRFNPQ